MPLEAPVTTAIRSSGLIAADSNATGIDSPAVTRFEGKRGLVLGVANKRSIAWAIARRVSAEGAQLAFTYQGERIESAVRELAESVGSPLVVECDVRSDEDVVRVVDQAAEALGGLDFVVHSVAFAHAEDLEGRFTDTPRDRFWTALDVCAVLARRGRARGGAPPRGDRAARS